jgi:hypothetical protein
MMRCSEERAEKGRVGRRYICIQYSTETIGSIVNSIIASIILDNRNEESTITSLA